MGQIIEFQNHSKEKVQQDPLDLAIKDIETINLNDANTQEKLHLVVEAIKDFPPNHPKLKQINTIIEKKSLELGGDKNLPFEKRIKNLENRKIHLHSKENDSRYGKMLESESSYRETSKLLSQFLKTVDNAIYNIDDVDYKKSGTTELEDFAQKKQFIDAIKKTDKLRNELLAKGVNFEGKRVLLKYAPKNEWYVTNLIKRMTNKAGIHGDRETKDRNFFSAILGNFDVFNITSSGKRETLKKELEALSVKAQAELSNLAVERKVIMGSITDYIDTTKTNILSTHDNRYKPTA